MILTNEQRSRLDAVLRRRVDVIVAEAEQADMSMPFGEAIEEAISQLEEDADIVEADAKRGDDE